MRRRLLTVVTITSGIAISCAILWIGFFVSAFKFVPLVGLDTTRRYYIYQWSDEPVGRGPAVVSRDGTNYFLIRVGLPTFELDRPKGKFLSYLLYDPLGTDATEWYTPDQATIVDGTLRFEVGDDEKVEYRLRE
jgi:hypothetical protein